MRAKRQLADYDPLAAFSVTAVENDSIQVAALLDAFAMAPAEEQTQFAFFVAAPWKKAVDAR